jgi:site-specific DNA recombinase
MARKKERRDERAVVGYVRVSTDEQAEHGFGLEVQEQRIRAYCEALGKPLARVYRDDGYSGGTLERPGLQAMLEAMGRGEVGTVVIAKLDRLSRSLKNLLILFADEFQANGVGLVSVAENFDTSTPAGVLFFQMVGSFAEFERNVITERTSGGRKEKAKRGGYAGGGAPFGYVARRGSRVLFIDERAAQAVRRAFELAAQGLSQRKIAATLNAEGYRTAEGREFKQAQVQRILARRDIYAGRYRYADVEAERGEHPPILADPTPVPRGA